MSHLESSRTNIVSMAPSSNEAVPKAAQNHEPADETRIGPAPLKEIPAFIIKDETITGVGQGTLPIHLIPDPERVVPLDKLTAQNGHIVDCPFCQQRTGAKVEEDGSGHQCIAVLVLCLFCPPLALVPCFTGWGIGHKYYCMNCRQLLAHQPYESPIQVFGPGSTDGTMPSQYLPMPPMQRPERTAQRGNH
ncbi:hypothetical protein B0I35DRAFT_427125 [Stachybotrys elegans]|uniref:LITAF domain-containing protein n=1 Tax=Stachybotrys elegans TaxID=80388 RepID=A0A8K0WUE8_9HYPO|nr:hypothetical protein B0I35DRAFT_427125 [Stachybotrys elegans]